MKIFVRVIFRPNSDLLLNQIAEKFLRSLEFSFFFYINELICDAKVQDAKFDREWIIDCDYENDGLE